MARRIEGEWRRVAIAVVGLTTAFLLAGCNSTPKTYFDWGLNDKPPRSVRTADSRPVHRKSKPRRASPQPEVRDNCVAPKQTEAAQPSKARTVSSARSPNFAWPLPEHGEVISQFGASTDGERNDGINIAVPTDTPIRAAAPGTVGYVGDEISGFGNLMLIRHAGDYVTTYAHAKNFTVQRGDTVKAGDIIGYTGASGDVKRPQLHFEIRRGVTPLNPMRLLASS